MNEKIVIGEGEMDEAPMLYIGENLRTGNGGLLDIAVDPLNGSTLTAKNLHNAILVIAVSEKGNLFQAPDKYMEKIAIGSGFPENIAESKSVKISDLTVCLLERDIHIFGLSIHYLCHFACSCKHLLPFFFKDRTLKRMWY